MAPKMCMMVLLVTVLAMGTSSVFARRDLQGFNGIPGVNILGGAVPGVTVTLVDVPGLRITSHTEAPREGFVDLITFMSGNGPPPTISIEDKIEGTWLHPVTFSSTTELPSNLVSSILSKVLPNSIPSFPGLPTTGIPTSPLPFIGTIHAAAGHHDVGVDVPTVDVSSKPSTTVHASLWNFGIPGWNIPLPRFPFPFGAHPPLAPASQRNETSSPAPSPKWSPERANAPPPATASQRNETSSPAPSPKWSPESSNAPSPSHPPPAPASQRNETSSPAPSPK